MGTRFRALAAPVDASTGDRRRFREGAITTQALPMPGRWQREDAGGHDYAVSVASLDTVDIQGADVWVEGEWFDDIDPAEMPRLAEDVKEAMYLAEKGVVGFSVDLDDFDGIFVKVGEDEEITEADFEDPDLQVEMLVTQGRMRAATLVAIPAFVETNHTIQNLTDGNEAVEEIEDEEDSEEDLPIVASVSGDTDLPVLEDREHEWDGPGAAGRVLDDAEDEDGNVDKAKAGRAFLWVDGDGTKRGDYSLGFADLVDGELRIIPRGVAATAGGHGVDATDLPDSDKDAIKSRVCSLYAKVRDAFDDWPECPFDGGDDAETSGEAARECAKELSLTAAQRYALVANQGAEGQYPAAMFEAPVPVNGPIPMTYDTERGIAYGHIYQSGTCHVGFKDECRMPPTDEDFSRFHVHPVTTSEGVRYAGRITAGGDHASGQLSLTQVQRAHDAKVTVAYVTASVDDFGIFVCGPMVPGLDDQSLKIMSRRMVSGHWPVINESGDIALAEVLALRDSGDSRLSEPGFPVSLRFAYRGGEFSGITAAAGPQPEAEARVLGAADYAEIFRIAYNTIKTEEAEKAEADALRQELSLVLSSESDALRQELEGIVAKATEGGPHV